LTDEASGIIHDFRRKRGVAHTEIMGPPNAPEWIYDRHTLWNAVESIERRRDAQLAREIEIALPVELSLDDHVELIHRYVRCEFIAAGMIVDIAVHRDDIHNPHAHLMLSTRGITAQGFGPKEPAWSETERLIGWRRDWADLVDALLAKIGVERLRLVDHRLLEVRGCKMMAGICMPLAEAIGNSNIRANQDG
jgi:hypothetical protein